MTPSRRRPFTRSPKDAAPLRAGVARADITDCRAGPVADPLYVKALALRQGGTTAVIITVDAVALEEIGPLKKGYLADVRSQLMRHLGISPANVLIAASHCHGIVCADAARRTVQAVKEALRSMVPVKVGAGVGHEDRIMENRRLRLKDGREADVRHAHSLPPDEEVVGVGPVDPQIGILRLDREDGRPLAVVYNFACHPIQGVPGGGNTADIAGFASRTIEENLADGAIALFLQGCAGDINPVFYKDVDHPRDAEPLGTMLGLSALRAVRKVRCGRGGPLKVIAETLTLPRADLARHIESLQAEQMRLLHSLKGTTLNLKAFLSLIVKHGLSPDFPSYYSHRYLHEKMMAREHLRRLDAQNRMDMKKYVENIHTMERLTRVQVNLALLKMHHAQNLAAGKSGCAAASALRVDSDRFPLRRGRVSQMNRQQPPSNSMTIDVEVMGLRIGDFVLVTFPGELSVRIGLNIKKRSPRRFTFVAGCANGYIYYAPTAEQLRNRGGAQEDSDCLLSPEWQALYEKKAVAMLRQL